MRNRVIAAAVEGVTAAEKMLHVAMEGEFPLGTPVTVTHARGVFNGQISGYDPRGARLGVLNDMTQKQSWQYFEHVSRT